MWAAPSTWRARMCVMLPRARNAEYSGFMAAPGTPNAVVTPSRSSTCTAASIALILDIVLLLLDLVGRVGGSGRLDLRPNERRQILGVLVEIDFDPAVEHLVRLHLVDVLLPRRDDHGRHAVADEVAERPRDAHEPVDRQHEHQA